MQRLTDQEMKEVTGGKVYKVWCYGMNKVSTGIRNCGDWWEYRSGSKNLLHFMHGIHMTQTGHKYAKFNWF